MKLSAIPAAAVLLLASALTAASGFASNHSSIGSCYYRGAHITSKTYLSGGPGLNASVYALCDEASGQVNCFTEGGARLPSCHQPQQSNRGCVHHDGTQISDYQQLQDDVHGTKYYAICDDASSELKCYQDDGTEQGDQQVSCDAAPSAASVQNPTERDRRLGVYYSAGPNRITPWPKGVVCYRLQMNIFARHTEEFQETQTAQIFQGLFNAAWDYTALQPNQKQWLMDNYGKGKSPYFEADENYDLKTLLFGAFDKYNEAGVEFIPLSACQQRANVIGDICNNCERAVHIRFGILQTLYDNAGVPLTTPNPDYVCNAYMGYELRVERLVMNLSSYCWQKGGIRHEVGHVVGLHHTHQHPDRDRHVIVFPDYGTDLFKTTNYAKLPRDETSGVYDSQSVMHYGNIHNVCKPNRELAAGERWCDVLESEGCVTPTREACKTGENDKVGGDEVTDLDLAAVKELYAEQLGLKSAAVIARKRPREEE